MGATHHLHPNVRFLQLQSSDEKSTVRSDRKSLIKLKDTSLDVSFFCVFNSYSSRFLGKVKIQFNLFIIIYY